MRHSPAVQRGGDRAEHEHLHDVFQEEVWAAEQGVLYGHLHIHLLFPTFTVTSRDVPGSGMVTP